MEDAKPKTKEAECGTGGSGTEKNHGEKGLERGDEDQKTR